jgi:hypothetical protein
MTNPKQHISVERAHDFLKEGQPITDFYVDGELRVETGDSWDKEIVLENCVIDHFSGSATTFNKPIKLINCHFKNCQFVFTYFLGGLTIENCTFDNYLDFQAGGHNKIGNPVIIANNDFNGFVNFFDCWYENEVRIINNRFHKGTNLLGHPFDIAVTFNINPIIENNVGELDLNTEGNLSS